MTRNFFISKSLNSKSLDSFFGCLFQQISAFYIRMFVEQEFIDKLFVIFFTGSFYRLSTYLFNESAIITFSQHCHDGITPYSSPLTSFFF